MTHRAGQGYATCPAPLAIDKPIKVESLGASRPSNSPSPEIPARSSDMLGLFAPHLCAFRLRLVLNAANSAVHMAQPCDAPCERKAAGHVRRAEPIRKVCPHACSKRRCPQGIDQARPAFLEGWAKADEQAQRGIPTFRRGPDVHGLWPRVRPAHEPARIAVSK